MANLVPIVVFLLLAVLVLGILIQTSASPSPEFAVDDLRPGDASVHADGTMDVSAAVTNVGEHDGTQRVELRIGNAVYGNATVELAAGETKRVRFENVAADARRIGTYTYGVYSESHEATATLSIEGDGPPRFVVRRLEPGDVVLGDGDSFDVTGIVTNVGESTGNRTVQFRLGDLLTVNNSVELGPGESETIRLYGIDASGIYAGTYTYGLYTVGDSETATLSIDRTHPPRLVVGAVNVTTPSIHRSGAYNLEATVTNDGDEGGPETLTIYVDGEPTHRERVQIAPGETETLRIEGLTAPDVGVHRIKVSSGYTARSDSLVVEGNRPARFVIEDVQPGNFSVRHGGRMNVTANVTNVGERTATQTVIIRIALRVFGRTDLTLHPGETKRVWVYNANTDYVRPGTYSYEVFTDDDAARAWVTVEE